MDALFLSLGLLLTPANEIAYHFKGPVLDHEGSVINVDVKISSHVRPFDGVGHVWFMFDGGPRDLFIAWVDLDAEWGATSVQSGRGERHGGEFHIAHRYIWVYRNYEDYEAEKYLFAFRIQCWKVGKREEM